MSILRIVTDCLCLCFTSQIFSMEKESPDFVGFFFNWRKPLRPPPLCPQQQQSRPPAWAPQDWGYSLTPDSHISCEAFPKGKTLTFSCRNLCSWEGSYLNWYLYYTRKNTACIYMSAIGVVKESSTCSFASCQYLKVVLVSMGMKTELLR